MSDKKVDDGEKEARKAEEAEAERRRQVIHGEVDPTNPAKADPNVDASRDDE